jgi:GTP cyclohydrolase II
MQQFFDSKNSSDIGFPDTEQYRRRYQVDGIEYCVRLVAAAALPSRFGNFTLYGFLDSFGNREHTAVVHGDVQGKAGVAVRLHSECHTGDVLGSLRCDCRDQLEAALRYISTEAYGVVVYLKQEGRGIGLLNKIKAYELQDRGFDTVDANLHLGFAPDQRNYAAAARILELLGLKSLRLLTNNPAKLAGLEAEGIRVIGRLPLVIEANTHNDRYLKTKQERMDHIF